MNNIPVKITLEISPGISIEEFAAMDSQGQWQIIQEALAMGDFHNEDFEIDLPYHLRVKLYTENK